MALFHLTVLLLLCVTIFCLEAYVFDSCEYNKYMLGKTCYKFRFKDKLETWNSSKSKCSSFGEVLAEPRDQAEKKALRDLIKAKGNDYWIGLKRINGIWEWTGSEETYNPSQRDLHRDWISGSPNNGTDEVCAYASACNGGKWAEANCNLKKRTICMDEKTRKKRSKRAVGVSGNWGSCSKTCGTGIQTRRDSSGQEEYQFCNKQQCQQSWATCYVDRDPHYLTFDVQGYNFQGGDHEGRECKFLLAGRCRQTSPLPPFKILAANSHRGNQHVSWVKAIELHYNGSVIRADHATQNSWFFREDGVRVYHTPYTTVTGITVTKHYQGVRLSIENELVYVTYNGHRRVIVGVKSCFRGKNGLCGLCGNYDGNRANDLYLRKGTPSTSGTDLGWSYQEPDKHGRFCHKENVAPCEKTNCRHAKPCDVLNDRHVFGSCPWYYKARNACAIDMCCAPKRPDICEVFRQYAKECARLGHKVPSDWRKRSGYVNCAGNRRKIHPNIRPVADEVIGEEESWK